MPSPRMRALGGVRRIVIFIGCIAALLGVVGIATAQAPPEDDARWTCSASAARVVLAGTTILEPIVANRGGDPCRDANPQVLNIDEADLLGPAVPIVVEVVEHAAFARTELSGEGGPVRDQVATAESGADTTRIRLASRADPSTELVIELEAARATASASCVAGEPVFETDFTALEARINGTPVPIEDLGAEIINALPDELDPLLDIETGVVTTEGDAASEEQSTTIRAIEINVLSAAGPPALLSVVLGESTVDRHGDVCAEPPPPPVVCPPGSVETPPGSGTCVITETECPPEAVKTEDGNCVIFETECPEGSVKTEDGTCVVFETECPPGSTQNPDNGQCEVPPNPDGTCPAGSVKTEDGRCVVAETDCPTGSVKTEDGVCVVAETECPDGSVRNAQNQCVVTETECPPNSTRDDQTGQCVVNEDQVQCPDGSVRDDQNRCVVAEPDCPEGSTRNADGNCVVGQDQVQCPEGSVRTADGQCVVTETQCPPGSVRAPDGVCVVAAAPQEQQPVGGEVVPIDTVPGASASPCSRRGFGRQVAIVGTNGRDRITGTNRSDRIFAFGGNDRVSGGRGNDCQEGGDGNDNLDGSNGTDYLLGGNGRDILNGGTGRDVLQGASGNDKLTGGSGNDRMEGGTGRDRLSGGFGKDRLIGGSGRDYMDGGNGADRFFGGSGNDVINAATSGRGRDFVNCGSGRDAVRANPDDRINRNCERVLILRNDRRRRR